MLRKQQLKLAKDVSLPFPSQSDVLATTVQTLQLLLGLAKPSVCRQIFELFVLCLLASK